MAKLDEMKTIRKEWVESLQSALAALDRRLDEIEERLLEAEPLHQQFAGLVGAARSAQSALNRTLREIQSAAGDAWTVFARESERALDELQHDVAITEAEVATELADARPTLVSLATGLVATWRARLDALRVQAELGRAEAEDAFNEAWSRVEERYAELHRRTDMLRDDTTRTVDEMRRSLRAASAELRSAFDAAASFVRQERD